MAKGYSRDEGLQDGCNRADFPFVAQHALDIAAAPSLLAPSPTSMYAAVLKPTLDRVLAAMLLVLLIPLFATLAIVVRIALGPGVLYRQQRVGKGGRPFTIVKFRTMAGDRRLGGPAGTDRLPSGQDRRHCHKRVDDPRHHPTGRRLRALRLDELPQLWNVVRGEMSLVGPRPELLSVVRMYEPWQHRRHEVRPGLTGLWQVSDTGNQLMHSVAASSIDLAYVERISLRTDIGILIRTPLAALRRSGS